MSDNSPLKILLLAAEVFDPKRGPDRTGLKVAYADHRELAGVKAPFSIRVVTAGGDEMANEKTFNGYGPEQGYDFLRQAIAVNDFQAKGCQVDADEVFVCD